MDVIATLTILTIAFVAGRAVASIAGHGRFGRLDWALLVAALIGSAAVLAGAA